MPEAPGYQGPRGRAGSPGAGLRTSGHVGGRGWCPSCRWASRRLPEVRSCWGRAGHATASDCGTPSPVHGGPWACSGHRPGGPGFRVPKIMTVHQLHPCACPGEPPWPDACSNSHLHIRGGRGARLMCGPSLRQAFASGSNPRPTATPHSWPRPGVPGPRALSPEAAVFWAWLCWSDPDSRDSRHWALGNTELPFRVWEGELRAQGASRQPGGRWAYTLGGLSLEP